MSRSTRLASASYILSYIAAREGAHVTTDAIAEAVRDHPARVRQLISALVKAGLVNSVRGANGGVLLAKDPNDISLKDIYEAVKEQPMISLTLKLPNKDWEHICGVHSALSSLYQQMEDEFQDRLSQIRLNQLYTPLRDRP